MPVEHDPLTQIVNVHWEEERSGFLYSGADGMFGSSDGIEWHQNKKGVAAATLAFVDDVWVAFGRRNGEAWRSTDGATSWTPIPNAPALIQVVAMKPTGGKQGVFAGWKEDDDTGDGQIYVSKDLGKSWQLAKTIISSWPAGIYEIPGPSGPIIINLTGYEIINGISSGGGALFVCTIWGSSQFHTGDGKIYSSITGDSFSEQTVFGPGTENFPDPTLTVPRPTDGFATSAVAYDGKTKIYMATGLRQRTEAGEAFYDMIYTTSSSPSFGEGHGTSLVSRQYPATLRTVGAASGGDGVHIGAFSISQYSLTGAFIEGSINVVFIPGAAQLLLSGFGGTITSICFKSDSEESTEGSTDEGDTGIFACCAFASTLNGGVYIARAGQNVHNTHSGTAFGTAPNIFRPCGEVAVGNIDFLESSTA